MFVIIYQKKTASEHLKQFMKYCLFGYSLGKSDFHVINFTGTFSFERSYISRLARLVRSLDALRDLRPKGASLSQVSML